MTFRVLVTPRAQTKLAEIAGWYRTRSGAEEVAEQWLQNFQSAADGLRQHPDRHPEIRERVRLKVPVREVLFGGGKKLTHRILFQIEAEQVVILTVRHAAQSDLGEEDL